ncbi:exodeoxyribonuclease VII large subunit [Peribacillus saganii]|uniref:Exodeoxyribonuclease 7 large subunit n=1 Tax=Peribacillus saganii TaxID=2303992 RepID=A0A372LPE5_9BACI|nr:exodeoxyribonuclease VII large subunit [Peribacillus saganii]RFU69820.1 exodeoxyribonuclease VII large subunit [Peribacillus saganii]
MNDQKYLTVSALTRYIKRKFDVDPHLRDIYLKGEISNFKQHSSGHMYFTLKDERARILAVMFAANTASLKFKPQNGMNVLLRGDITVYEQSGQYQMYVKQMTTDGIGDLYIAYEQLKNRLEQEGLFSPLHKEKLPKYPSAVGVITSPTGAALRDILTTLKRRYPVAKVIIYPALVQGTAAAASVAKAITAANRRQETDVLIVGRGGGSIEELWAFNEEVVARAIFESKIPIISAVGHETDYTIADFAADLRAPTPTGAAEMAVPHLNELMERLQNRKNRLTRSVREKANADAARLARLDRSYAFRYPRQMYEQKLEQLDRAMERLKRESKRFFINKTDMLQRHVTALKKQHPQQRIADAESVLNRQERSIRRQMERIFAEKAKSLTHAISTLDALSPLKIMERGYSLTFTDNDTLVKSTEQVNKGDIITVTLRDGKIKAEVKDKRESAVNE